MVLRLPNSQLSTRNFLLYLPPAHITLFIAPMSDGTFAVSPAPIPEETHQQLSPLEKRLWELLIRTRKLIGELSLVTKTLFIPGILDRPTPVTVYFETDPNIGLDAFITFQTANTDYKRFYIPCVWTGIAPAGQIGLSTAVTILENLNLHLQYKYIIPLHELFAENSLAHEKTAHAGIADEHTEVARV